MPTRIPPPFSSTLQRLLSKRHLWLQLVVSLGRYIPGHNQLSRHSSVPQLMAGDTRAVDAYCTLPPITDFVLPERTQVNS